MKIFVVHASHRLTDYAAHGDGLIVWGFISTLAAQGHELWVVTPRLDLKSAPPPRVHLFELAPRSKNPVLKLANYIVRSRALYNELARTVKFDIIHQFNPVVRGYSFGMLGVPVPLVMGPYNGDWPVTKSAGPILKRFRANAVGVLRVAIDLAMQRLASGLLITTPYALNRLPGLSPKSKKLFVVPNGIDESLFAPRANGHESGPPTILMIGCATHKGVFTMLDAFELIGEANADVRLTIAGGGPQSADVEAIVAKSKHCGRIDIIGGVSRETMPDQLRQASIVAVPSYGEPYGMVVLEAMASAKPVAGTNAGGIPYLLGAEGDMLFAPGDDRALARIIIDLLADPHRLRIIGAAKRLRVLEHFTWDAATKKMVEAYKAVTSV